MQITVKVSKELEEQARSRGMNIETYVQELLEQKVRDAASTPSPRRSFAEITQWLESLAQFSDKIPPLPTAITREWIYQDHD